MKSTQRSAPWDRGLRGDRELLELVRGREREGSGRVSDTDVMSCALSLGSLWSCLRLQDRKDARVLCGLSDTLIMSWVVHTSRPINATRMFKAL